MAREVELTASYWSTAGNAYPGGPAEASSFGFRDRVETGRRIGYRGMGFVHADIVAAEQQLGLETMKKILDDNGMKYVEIEMIMDWFAEGERGARSDRIRADLLRVAEPLGACHIKIGGDLVDSSDDPRRIDRMAEDFGILCAQAADVGTSIALELMPFSNLATIDHGLQLIRGSGARNGGLLLDIWHMARGGIDAARIRTTPTEAIAWIELNDADAAIVGDLWNDTLHHRKLPGEGALDIAGFLRAVRDAGYAGPYGVEILSREHRARPLADALERPFTTAMAQFERLG